MAKSEHPGQFEGKQMHLDDVLEEVFRYLLLVAENYEKVTTDILLSPSWKVEAVLQCLVLDPILYYRVCDALLTYIGVNITQYPLRLLPYNPLGCEDEHRTEKIAFTLSFYKERFGYEAPADVWNDDGQHFSHRSPVRFVTSSPCTKMQEAANHPPKSLGGSSSSSSAVSPATKYNAPANSLSNTVPTASGFIMPQKVATLSICTKTKKLTITPNLDVLFGQPVVAAIAIPQTTLTRPRVGTNAIITPSTVTSSVLAADASTNAQPKLSNTAARAPSPLDERSMSKSDFAALTRGGTRIVEATAPPHSTIVQEVTATIAEPPPQFKTRGINFIDQHNYTVHKRIKHDTEWFVSFRSYAASCDIMLSKLCFFLGNHQLDGKTKIDLRQIKDTDSIRVYSVGEEQVILVIWNAQRERYILRTKQNSPLQVIFDKYFERSGDDVSEVYFTYNREIVQGRDTPKMFEMCDHDELEVVIF